MLKWIVLAVVVAAVWAASLFFGISLFVPGAFTGVLALAVVGVIVVRRVRARRAAAQLEKALAAQAAEHARSARPDLRSELQQVNAEFEKAIAALKSSKVGRRGDALYAMPWYMIIGPPGAGKSTALRNSGLQFPYLSSRTGGGVRGVGGTRNCDWWLTNDAVILDTAGRWSTEDEDHDEWLGFLDLLKRFRSKKPLNGVIVAVSVAELGGASSDAIAELAKRIRDRIDETQGQLSLSLPVYLLFTKCDLVPGFVEAFQALSKAERGQIWGFTAPVTEPMTDPGAYFGARMDELLRQVERWALGRLGDERQIRAREMIYGLPEQLKVLMPKLRELTDHLFEENVFKDTPALRGAYFTSGTQEGRPIDRVMHRMAEAFGMRGQLPTAAPAVEQKSYFLHDVFTEVVFRDADLAVRSDAELRRQRLLRYAVAGGIFAVAALLSTFPTYSYLRNRDRLDTIASVVDASAAAMTDAVGRDRLLAPDALEALRERVVELDEWAEEGAPWLDRSGMYVGETVRAPLSHYYAWLVRQGVIAPLAAQELEALNRFGREYEAMASETPPADVHRTNFQRLKHHLLLTIPVEATQPALEGELADELAGELARSWGSALTAAPSVVEAMQAHVGHFVGAMPAAEDLALPRDRDGVRRARAALSRVSESDLLLETLIQRMSDRGYDLSLADLLGRPISAFHARREVRGAFTRRAWEEHVKPQLAGLVDGFASEVWVLGPDYLGARDADAAERTQRAVRSEYFRRYIDEWREFVRGLHMMPPDGNQQALQLFQDLTRGEPTPLSRLYLQIKHNVTLAEPPPPQAAAEGAAADAALEAAQRRLAAAPGGQALTQALTAVQGSVRATPPDPHQVTEVDVEAALRGFTRFGVPAPAPEGEESPPPPLAAYEEQLLYLRDAIQTHLDDPSDPAPLTQKLQTARTTVQGMIAQQDVGWRPAFESILWPPIDGASMSLSRAVATEAGRGWCSEVRRVYDAQLNARYPFDPRGQDVSLADFAAFYRPREGTLWAFYEQRLERAVGRQGDRFEFTTRLGRPASEVYQRALVPYLQRARDITTVFFPPGATEPKVELDVRIRPAERVAVQSFSLGGKTVEYHNEPESWQRVSWPGAEPGAGAAIEISGEGGMHERIAQEGEWGLFRLLESGTVAASSARSFTATFDLRSHDVRVVIDLRPVRSDTPFFGVQGRDRAPRFLSPLRATDAVPPGEIVTESRLCTETR
jgi:type VI secretion system protein ImpL